MLCNSAILTCKERERRREIYIQARGKTQCLGSYGLKKLKSVVVIQYITSCPCPCVLKKEVKKGIPEWQQDFHVITHCATVMFKTEKLMFENSLIFELVVANLC